jgi:oligopeptide transport system substrate-binding protein
VTAGDFEFAWRRVLEPGTGSPNADLLYDVLGARAFHRGTESDPDRLGIRALNDVALEVELEEATGHLLQLLTTTATYPVPRHVVEAHGESWTEVGKFVNNGPFRLEARPSDELIVLTRNPAYHGRFTGNLQRVEISLVLSRDSSLALLETYEDDHLDVYNTLRLRASDMDRVRQRHPGDFVSEPWLHANYLAFNTSRPPFDDVRVRRAFVLAADRETLASVALGGFVVPATGGFVPPGMPGHSPGIALPYDPESARQLLAEAGYPGGRGFPSVVHLTMTTTVHQEYGEYLCQAWQEQLGVEVRDQPTEWDSFYDSVDRQPPDLWGWGWVADYPDPDSFLRVGVATTPTGWTSGTFDVLVEQARRLTDQRQRMLLYGQADLILVEEAAIVPLFYNRNTLLIKPWVRKFPLSARGGWFLKDTVIEAH